MEVESSATPQVLYVDPDEGAREAAAAAFEAAGLSAVGVDSRADAMERLLAAEVACVVSERRLADDEVLSLLDATRERFPALPFVVFTADGSEAFASEAVGAGVSDYLPKPDETTAAAFEPLVERVRDLVVDGRRDAPELRQHRADPAEVADGDDLQAVAQADERLAERGEAARPSATAAAGGDGGAPAEDAPADAIPDDAADLDRDVPADPGKDVAAGIPERLKERAMDEAPVGITIADATAEDDPLIYINEAFERLTGFPAAAVTGHNCRFLQGPETDPEPVETLREAVEATEPASVELLNYRADGERFWNRVDIAPIFEDGELTHYVGFQTDVSRRKRAEAAAKHRADQLERERANLSELLDRVEGLVGDVTERVVAAETREGVWEALQTGVMGADPYAFAWVGERDLATDEVSPVGVADDGVFEDLDPAFEGDDPVRRAVETGDVQVVADAGSGLHGGDWPDRFRSMAAVPLAYRDSLYGVLAVYGTEQDVFDEREQVVLSALGRAAGTAVNAIESHRGLAAETVTELEFDVAGTDAPFVTLASALSCTVTFEGAFEDEDGLELLFDVEGADGEAVVDWLEEQSVPAAVVADHGDGCLLELVGEDSFAAALAEQGVDLRHVEADPDEARLTVHVSPDADDRETVELVEDQLPGASLVAYRTRERDPRTPREFRAAVENQLTDRQQGALQRAYASGFFEWPRPVDGDELAESMDITRATFHQHLRAGQRKLVAAFYGDEK